MSQYVAIHPSLFLPGREYYLAHRHGGMYSVGKFVSSSISGVSYDPDLLLTFEIPAGKTYTIKWNMGMLVFYDADDLMDIEGADSDKN